jgi:uncharacterized protein with FMN-binding domain
MVLKQNIMFNGTIGNQQNNQTSNRSINTTNSMSSLTKKILPGAVIIIAIGGFIFWSGSQNTSTTTITDTTSTNTTILSGIYKDTTYTDTTASSIYGDEETSTTISGGKLTDATFIKIPNGQGHTDKVITMSEPILKSKAIASRGVSVNIISDTTQTTEVFQVSLKSALIQA